MDPMEKSEFTETVLQFFDKQKSWTVEHYWGLDDNGNKISEFIGMPTQVNVGCRISDLLLMRRGNGIHNHPSEVSIPSPPDLMIALGSGGTHYMTGKDGITEIIVGRPKWIWTTLKARFDWEYELSVAFRDTIIRNSDIKTGTFDPDWSVLENRLRILLDQLSVKVFFHKAEMETSRDQTKLMGQSGRWF